MEQSRPSDGACGELNLLSLQEILSMAQDARRNGQRNTLLQCLNHISGERFGELQQDPMLLKDFAPLLKEINDRTYVVLTMRPQFWEEYRRVAKVRKLQRAREAKERSAEKREEKEQPITFAQIIFGSAMQRAHCIDFFSYHPEMKAWILERLKNIDEEMEKEAAWEYFRDIVESLKTHALPTEFGVQLLSILEGRDLVSRETWYKHLGQQDPEREEELPELDELAPSVEELEST